MTIRRANPLKQGEIGLGAAILWRFCANGYCVAIPIADNSPTTSSSTAASNCFASRCRPRPRVALTARSS